MEETMMKQMDYKEASAALKKALDLSFSPVAIRLALGKEDIPDGMEL